MNPVIRPHRLEISPLWRAAIASATSLMLLAGCGDSSGDKSAPASSSAAEKTAAASAAQKPGASPAKRR